MSRKRVLRLEEKLHRRVVGQDEAVSAAADAVVRAGAGIKDPKRPIDSFRFLGADPIAGPAFGLSPTLSRFENAVGATLDTAPAIA